MAQPTALHRAARLRRLVASLVLATVFAAGTTRVAEAALTRHLASAQVPTLSERVRTSEDPLALRNEIDTFLDFHVGRLFGEDRTAVSQSRDLLSEAVADPATNAFKRLYAELLIERLNRRAASAATFNQLNCAIVIERVTRQTQDLRFGPLITRLAGDDDASVVIWAAKAAYSIFPELLAGLGTRDREALVNALATAVQRFPDNGALAEEVYRTLSMRTIELRPPAEALLAGGAPAIVPALQNVIAFRTQRYAPNAPAPDPLAELPGPVVLTNAVVWNAQNDAQRQRTVAVLRDLMLQVTATAANLDQQDQGRRILVDIVKRVGSAFEGISGPAQLNGEPAIPGVFAAAQAVRRMGPVPNVNTLNTNVQGLDQALQAAFQGLPAPQLSTRPAEQDATTRPTTGAADE